MNLFFVSLHNLFEVTRTSVHSEMSKAKNGHFQGFVQNKK